MLFILYCRRRQRKLAMKKGGFTQYGGTDDGVFGSGEAMEPVAPETAE